MDDDEEKRVEAWSVACLIDKDAAIGKLIRMLKKRRGERAAITSFLRNLTKNNFGYYPEASAGARAKAVRRWIEWWESRQPAE